MQSQFYRKIFYGVVLLVLAISLWFIGNPSRIVVGAGGEVQYAPGGVLAQYRTEAKMSEVQLGEIDPAGSAAKLATFGMRGVAISLLWHQANEKQKKHVWNDVVAIGNQIIFLEPHFVPVWDFLGWTLAYNASADFDDYRERYRWVIRGIDFLITGVKKNQRAPKLHGRTGWTISQKVGIADEVEQYRRLLRDDEQFGERHECPLPSDRDNWLLGRRWYGWGEALVLEGESLFNESDFVYFSKSRLNLFNYAKWKRKDGIFGEEAMRAWDKALEDWIEFGKMELRTAIPKGDTIQRVDKYNKDNVHLAKLETTEIEQEKEKALLAELHEIDPDLKEILIIARWHQLSEKAGQQGALLRILENAPELVSKKYNEYQPIEELKILRQWLDVNKPDWRTRLTEDRNSLIPEEQTEIRKIPSLFLDEEQRAEINKTDGEIGQVHHLVMAMLKLTPKTLSAEIQELDVPREMKNRARDIELELDGQRERTRYSDLFRGILNYESRFREVAIEHSQEADDAHRFRYEARKAYYAGDLTKARNGWLDSMRKWDELIDLDEFKGQEIVDADFIRGNIDIVEKFLIILDDSNKIFADVSDDPVPLRRMMWSKMFSSSEEEIPTLLEALDYAKKGYEQTLTETDATKRKEGLEEAERRFTIVARRFAEINMREKFMEYAPFFDVRDRTLESSAYYIRSLEQQGKPIPEPLILRSYVELMLKHDPATAAANEIRMGAFSLIQEQKYAEAVSALDGAIAAWLPILEKYPLIVHDPTISAYGEVALLAMEYAELLRLQGKSIPDDFPLKKFLR
jgi:hypothetical protein